MVGLALAQSPAVNPKEASQAAAEQQRQIEQPLNNAPVWKEVRSGEPQVTTVRGRETNVLIQPRGPDVARRCAFRSCSGAGSCSRSPLRGLAVFYLWRGHDGRRTRSRGDRMIERFSPMDRVRALVPSRSSWVALAITGLILSLGKAVLLPLIGYTLFSWLATLAKNLHNFIGPTAHHRACRG